MSVSVRGYSLGMEIVYQIQGYLTLGVGIALFAVELFAFIEALRGSSAMYLAYGKLTKPAWVGITALSAVFGFLSMGYPVSLFGVIAIVAAGIFLADVRPLVRGGKRNDGPYGPW